MSEPSKYTIHTQSSQIIENNSGTVIGIQNNHSTNPEIQRAIADLQTLLTDLQTQYPQVTTETEAIAIIDAELPRSNKPKPIDWQPFVNNSSTLSVICKPPKLLWEKLQNTT